MSSVKQNPEFPDHNGACHVSRHVVHATALTINVSHSLSRLA